MRARNDKRVSYFLFALLLGPGGLLQAACGDGRPATHRIAVSWNGLATLERYNAGMRVFHETLGQHATRHFVGRGAEQREATAPPTPAWAPEEGDRTRILPATRGGLQRVLQGVSQEVERLRATGVTPGEIELVVYVTNHGARMLNGPARSDFGINLRPTADDGTFLRRPDNVMWSQTLRDFGAGLPEGIRVKPIFSQCYGSDTMESFLSTVRTAPECKCGVAKAEPTHPSWGSAGNDADWSPNWDHTVIGALGQGTSLHEAAQRGHWGSNWGRSPVMHVDPHTSRYRHSSNGNMTSSQLVILSALRRAMQGQTTNVADWASFEFLANAPALLTRFQDRPLSPESRIVLAERKQQRHEAAQRAGITAGEIEEQDSYFAPTESGKRRTENSGELSRDLVFNSGLSPQQIQRRALQRSAKLVVLQDLLEETFFRVAPAESQRDFLARHACEKDPLALPPAAPPPVDVAARTPERNSAGRTHR